MKCSTQFRIGAIQGHKGIARPGVVDEYMQEMAGIHFGQMGNDDVKMHEEDKQAFIISRMTVEMYKDIPTESVIDAFTWVSEGKAANFPRNYELQLDGEVAARGLAAWALVDLDKGRLVRYSDSDFGKGIEEEMVALGIREKFKVPKDVEFTYVDDIKVQYWQTDINEHMNNVRYVDPLWCAIPKISKRRTKAFAIYYKHELAYGDTAKVMVSQAYPCDIKFNPELEGLIDNNYSPETDEIFYVNIVGEDGIRTQSMWIVSKVE